MKPTERISLGYIPLTDAAPLIVAVEKGFFADQGIDVTLVKETSWASIRDKVTMGILDGAHMLASMPLAATLGAAGPKQPMVAPFTLSRCGNAVTLSRELFSELCVLQPGLHDNLSLAAPALRQYIQLQAESGKPKVMLAMVFPTATHNYLLRDWLAKADIDPDNDVRMVVIPPEQMVNNLDNGNIAGFCAGEPWNSKAVQERSGVAVATSQDIKPDHPEKVLGFCQDWAAERSDSIRKLIRALTHSCAWLTDANNAQEAASILASPHWLNQPLECLLPSLTSRFRYSPEIGQTGPTPFHIFGPANVNRPDPKAAQWFLTQMLRWNQLEAADHQADLLEQVFSPELFDQA